MKLSIIITALNEFWKEVDDTIESFRKTAGDIEIILVDDCSSTPLNPKDKTVKVIHNQHRCGVGPSRTIGALAATGTHLLITDAHVRATPGWYQAALARIDARPKTVHCACCIGIDSKNLDPLTSRNIYEGGTINVFGKDKHNPALNQVFEAVWLPREQAPQDDEEIACCMGACYFVPRDWFLHLDPLSHLRSWGEDEIMLSVKSWLAGGDVRYMKNVRIGHRFRLSNEKVPWEITLGHRSYNKLFAIETLCDPAIATSLQGRINTQMNGSELDSGMKLFKADYYLAAQEREKNKRLFTRTFGWLAKKFNLPVG